MSEVSNERKGYNFKNKQDKDIFSDADLVANPDGFKKEEFIVQP